MFGYGYATSDYIPACDVQIGDTISYCSGSRAYGEYRMGTVSGIEVSDRGLYRLSVIDTSDDSDAVILAWEREDIEIWLD